MLTIVEGIYDKGVAHLLEQLPGVVRARVLVTVPPDAPAFWPQHSSPPLLSSPEDQEADAEQPMVRDAVVDRYQPRTELGFNLIELRRAYSRAGRRFLNWEEIDAKVRERRDGVAND